MTAEGVEHSRSSAVYDRRYSKKNPAKVNRIGFSPRSISDGVFADEIQTRAKARDYVLHCESAAQFVRNAG